MARYQTHLQQFWSKPKFWNQMIPTVGFDVGFFVGSSVGFGVGFFDGSNVGIGIRVGYGVGIISEYT